ncbi:bifunctional phosphopantothenoylcysteine decarboxylase/phosphopantothenate--cysteine ligase CoaBC [Alkaliphilus serpentinus]|uniref:Coenzyme A biosynthesis bifunctional protein CoaBC n=1 Tax=Alkaliphilus serpentinus TaxID=1482731 RepID=A0A833MF95_9FIRM|nr:bifunctional phosphopantothenoylcysteine decarboxylase/phosphopantothenate--cysteine ligase CoaBC [Alkaliphilus serpentinus]KAB3533143.1 bifunctional phosphopantothenoylcysteine decarboxylase/phosphopantothenate--cysteine ligase CoaBC [Alkaliphilus serpentinus]
MLKGKKIVIGVTGGIAAYKACDITSSLKKLGAEINVIMTESATHFVNPQTFQALSQNPVTVDMFDTPRYWDIEHISLAQKADLILVAPATANIIGKVINGIADDMLSTTIMASTAKVVFAPAMNTKMYLNPIVQNNIEGLKALGYAFIDPASGRLACGELGVGKLCEVEKIIVYVTELLSMEADLKGKKLLITAGPTIEAIDPVRYLTNHSTGKMGYAIAEAAHGRGAEVTLISGPTNLKPPAGMEFIRVNTAEEMYDRVLENFEENDIIIKSAAVADYRPEATHPQKMKKQDDDLYIKLVRNPDILMELGKRKGNKYLVGFAAETNDIIEYAKNKLKKKNLDLIVANDLTEEGAGFGKDTNVVYLIDSKEDTTKLDKMTKLEVAHKVLDKIVKSI